MKYSITIAALIVWMNVLPLSIEAAAGAELPEVRAAVEKSLRLLGESAATYARERQCFSCHHQSLPAMTAAAARERGIFLTPTSSLPESRFTIRDFSSSRALSVKGGSYSAGYALAGLSADRWPRDETTRGLVAYLVERQTDEGGWQIKTHRPPLEDSHFTATALALRGIARYADEHDVSAQQARVRGVRWLVEHEPETTEDQTFRLLGLHWSDAEAELIAQCGRRLLDQQQRDDGGWIQIEGRSSDAYATGQALTALVESGQLDTTSAAYRQGVDFLLGSQYDDGSWQVATRSRPLQTYFESGFPHGRDQFISTAATCWATLALLADLPGDDDPIRRARRPVFVSGTDGYHTFRIPALVTTLRGTLLAFAEGRKASRSDTGDIDTVLRRSHDGGETWQPLQLVAEDETHTMGNPCPVVDRMTGQIHLLLTRNHGADSQKEIETGTSHAPRTVWYTMSDDDGRSWSPRGEISATTRQPTWGWYGTGPGNGIQLLSGRLLVPCYHTPAASHVHLSHLIVSDDHGRTWQLGGICGPNCGESAVAESYDGSLVLSMRAHPATAGLRYSAISRDEGATWSSPAAGLIDPGCQASLLRIPSAGDDVRPWLALSNVPEARRRSTLTVQLSGDGGATWPRSYLIDAGPSAYSSLALLVDGRLGCLYERGEGNPYEVIAFTTIDFRGQKNK